ncbi:MAG: flagella basal body P-ring formation protein FlgA [Actinomycetaceae bacterium]|nr:flagella basal body P-ring formation protein FlgA [Arcanobacterium sp.]MDD7504870.1 flagella basal body P-ring formation protein FlgA [Actinomycetaceae bacterium]MDY6142705.1 flagella basal body P-ring formation protein FlgA [Arcanobacterium sp.]
MICAIICSVIVYSLLDALSQMRPHTEQVVVAARTIEAGSTIESGDVVFADIPEDLVAHGALASLDDAVGQTVVARMTPYTPIIEDQLLQSNFVGTAPPGTIVTPVPIANNGVVEMLQVGSRLDLYAPSSDPDTDPKATLIAENTLVLAISEQSSKPTLFREVNNTTTIFLAVPKSAANLVIGIGATTPMHAVLVDPAM